MTVEALGVGGFVAVRFAGVLRGGGGVGWGCWWGERDNLELLGHRLQGSEGLVNVEGEVCEMKVADYLVVVFSESGVLVDVLR